MSKIKLELRSIAGQIVFEYESENNTYKETVTNFLKEKAGELIRGIALSNMDLSEVDFSGSRFDNSRFDNSRFDNSRFDNSSFYNSSFDNSSFDNSSFYNSSFYNSSFYNSRFDNSRFDNSGFDNSSFYNSSFYNSSFYNSSFDNSSFDNETVKNIIANNQLRMFDSYKNCLWSVLLRAKNEIEGLKTALKEGRVDGSKYDGQCACLKGTIANIRHCDAKAIPGIKADTSEPSEQWFMMIKPAMTPENSEIVKLTVDWIEEFQMWLAA